MLACLTTRANELPRDHRKQIRDEENGESV